MPANQLSTYDEGYLLAEDERWLTIQHVVESPYFKKSPRLRICCCTSRSRRWLLVPTY